MRGHLPAPIINGGGNSLPKWSNFRRSRARDLDLDLGSGYAAYHRHLPTYQISLRSEENFFLRITTVVTAKFKVT